MDVFVVTRVVFDAEGKPTFITDVWRIFSAAKGSSAFHNECLHQITEYYRTVMQLELVYVCTDGCRGQYKGRRNFYKISIIVRPTAISKVLTSRYCGVVVVIKNVIADVAPALASYVELQVTPAAATLDPNLNIKARTLNSDALRPTAVIIVR